LNNKDKVLVGQFGAPVGLTGEIKVNIMTTTFEVFKKLENYTNLDGSIIWKFKNISFRGNKCVVLLDNCSSSEDASKFKGKKIYSNKNYLPITKDNEYYVVDLVGSKIIIRGTNTIGEVNNVKNFGAGDLLEVKLNMKMILIPFNKENIISVNIKKKEIVADPIMGILD
tara:strand:+ start:69 stop:575 length:507 start_codon:yes stop_codon:yes gene_type:complete